MISHFHILISNNYYSVDDLNFDIQLRRYVDTSMTYKQWPILLWHLCNVCHSCLWGTLESIQRISLNTGVLLRTLCWVHLFSFFFPFLFTIFSSPIIVLSYLSLSIPIPLNTYVYINPWGMPHPFLAFPIFNHIPEFTLTPPFSIYISESRFMWSELSGCCGCYTYLQTVYKP